MDLNLYTNNPTILAFVLVLMMLFFIKTRILCARSVFLVDFACHKGTEAQGYTKEKAMSLYKHYTSTSDDTLNFISKMLDRVGVGEKAYYPTMLLNDPPSPSLAAAREEAEEVLFGAVDGLLEKCGVKREEIGIVVANCTIFCPVPSLADMIVNKYKLRDDVLCYNMTGMGCSAGLAAIGLAKHLLQVHPNTYCLVLSTENITENLYVGKNRSMIISNTLFRMGASAVLLSNRQCDRRISKYELISTVHTMTASHDRSYKSIYIEEDEEGMFGVNIGKDLLMAAIKAIEANVSSLALIVLPLSEQIKLLTNYLIKTLRLAKVKTYVPNFGKQFDHFIPHVGGKPVLDELQKNLRFSEEQMEASKMTLYRFGNTSSSAVWYALAYCEAKGRIKNGHRLWQMAFGSGFKCSSAIWRALRNVDKEEVNPWIDEIDEFPVDVSKIKAVPVHFEPAKET